MKSVRRRVPLASSPFLDHTHMASAAVPDTLEDSQKSLLLVRTEPQDDVPGFFYSASKTSTFLPLTVSAAAATLRGAPARLGGPALETEADGRERSARESWSGDVVRRAYICAEAVVRAVACRSQLGVFGESCTV